MQMHTYFDYYLVGLLIQTQFHKQTQQTLQAKQMFRTLMLWSG